MKVSYNLLKQYLPFLESPEKTAQDLIMHTAEVEAVHYVGKNLENVIIGKVLERKKHPDSDRLGVCKVEVLGKEYQIVCGAPNVAEGMIVPVAMVGAKLAEDFIIEKTKIRGEVSEGMICSEDELGLKEERQEGILELPNDAPLGMSMREYLGKNDAVLEIDNKAINHRPDMFSYIGIMRELSVIHGEEFKISYETEDFSKVPLLKIENTIPSDVKRYIGLQIEGVKNIETPKEIRQIVESAGNNSKGLLIDISNYSLFFYGQPTHCFDADKIEGHIIIRYAREGESFIALDSKEYILGEKDIVIADTKKILALAGVIGAKSSSVSDVTTRIIVESAWFPGSILRHTGRRLGIRTDALNIFEKNIPTGLQIHGVSLIYKTLKEIFPKLNLSGYNDVYPDVEKQVRIEYDNTFTRNLIGKEYEDSQIQYILNLLGIHIEGRECIVPFWRKDMSKKADIAEEIARIDGFEKITPTTPRIDVGAIVQSNMMKLKSESRIFFTNIGFYDMYNYSFVNAPLMEKMNFSVAELIEMKNYLSEDLTHLRNSLIPNLMLGLKNNIREKKNIRLFELEKVFGVWKSEIYEAYHMAGVMTTTGQNAYYEIQNILVNFFTSIGVDKVMFEYPKGDFPPFTHKGRTAEIYIRGKKVGFVGEIHPQVAENFDVASRIAWFEINAEILSQNAFLVTKAQDISSFQENNFDLSFVVEKGVKGIEIQNKIKKTDTTLIQKVELFDIYEDEAKLPGKRSLSFTVYIQSQNETLSDEVKNELIKKIIAEVEKSGGKLR